MLGMYLNLTGSDDLLARVNHYASYTGPHDCELDSAIQLPLSWIEALNRFAAVPNELSRAAQPETFKRAEFLRRKQDQPVSLYTVLNVY